MSTLKLSLLATAVGSTMAYTTYQTLADDTSTSAETTNIVSIEQPIQVSNDSTAINLSDAIETPDGVIITPTPEPIVPNVSTYNIGAGIADITGEVAEANMFGYADGNQISRGVQQRLHARAFLIGDDAKEVLMIVLDNSNITQAMHQDLLARLAEKYGDRFSRENVMLTATHTHASPGGFSDYDLYKITTRGFQQATFDALQNGTMRAIDRAVSSQSEGTIEFGTSQLTNANVQRSRTAFINNPEATDNETAQDTLMQVLKLVKNGADVASVNWFAVHPTSLTNGNELISGDNKGYAAWYWEKQRGMNYITGDGYIAAFANSNAGDMSPNLNLMPGSGPTDNEWENAKIIGQRQAEAAINTNTTTQVSGGVDYRQNYVDFSSQQVDAKYTVDGQPHETCTATYKTSFAAGSTEDGGTSEGLVASNIVAEGRANPFLKGLGYFLAAPSPALVACHETDEIMLNMGDRRPYPGSPEVLPSQLLRVGNLAVISVPSEFTVVAGQRLRKLIAQKLTIPMDNVIFAGYSNAYAGYITTAEEYKRQDYEGASNHFGPHSLAAWKQNLDMLADAMINGETVPAGPTPRDLSARRSSSVAGVAFDSAPFNGNFGDIKTQPNTSYAQGNKASAVFWSAHPKSTLAYENALDANNMRETEPYTMAVQRNTAEGWVTVATDADWNTTNEWQRQGIAQSNATLTWDIPTDAQTGEYRFYHQGAYKNGWTGEHIPFEGYSDSFMVDAL